MPVGKRKIKKRNTTKSPGRSNSNVVQSGRGRSWKAAKEAAKKKARSKKK